MREEQKKASKKLNDSVVCPLCKKEFNANAAWMHINAFHKNASDKELMMIRDAKRTKVPFVSRPVRHTRSPILSQSYGSPGPDFSGGLPSLGKKR